jgi:quercetin dioxygenase-like cupin family protein
METRGRRSYGQWMTHFSTVGDGLELDSPDARITVKIDAEHTDGVYELFEVDAPRGPTMPLHATPWAKAYYVLHGRMGVLVDGEMFDMAPGSSLTIPPNAMHTFTVHTPTVKFLAVSMTDAMGRFFRDLDSGGHSAEVVSRHGITLDGVMP